MTGPTTAPVLLSYRALGLGDLLTAVPALRALRAAFPDHRHVLATSGWLAPLVSTIEAVDHHLRVDELAPLPAAAQGPDAAVNLHGAGPQSHRVLLATSPRRLIAFAHDQVAETAGAARWLAHEHEVTRWCRLLAEHGVPADPAALDLEPPPGPVPPGVAGATVIHPGGKSEARRWPPGRFAEVARRERAAGREVVVTGSRAEHHLAARIVALAGLPAEADLAGELDLGALARTVAGAARIVCGDTGVAHLATAYGTPSVVLFGPTPPSAWGPPPERRDRHRALWTGRRGDPHRSQVDAGLLESRPIRWRRFSKNSLHGNTFPGELTSPTRARIGAVFLLVGLVGFAVTGFDGFADPQGELLLGAFEVSPLHNVVHLLIGAAGVALWNRLDQARTFGWLLAIGYGAAFVYGLFVAGSDEQANFLALNQGDNWLHLISALAGLAIALWPHADRRTRHDRPAGSTTLR